METHVSTRLAEASAALTSLYGTPPPSPPPQAVFVYKILRPVYLQYAGNTQDPSGVVRRKGAWYGTFADRHRAPASDV